MLLSFLFLSIVFRL